MSVKDISKVEKGIKILDEESELSKITTSIGPYKEIGVSLALIEAEAYLGNSAKIDSLVEEVKEWAEDHFYPTTLLNSFLESVAEVVSEGGLASKWRSGGSIGGVRYPLPPSMGPKGCVYCHVGNKVPKSYYFGID